MIDVLGSGSDAEFAQLYFDRIAGLYDDSIFVGSRPFKGREMFTKNSFAKAPTESLPRINASTSNDLVVRDAEHDKSRLEPRGAGTVSKTIAKETVAERVIKNELASRPSCCSDLIICLVGGGFPVGNGQPSSRIETPGHENLVEGYVDESSSNESTGQSGLAGECRTAEEESSRLYGVGHRCH